LISLTSSWNSWRLKIPGIDREKKEKKEEKKKMKSQSEDQSSREQEQRGEAERRRRRRRRWWVVTILVFVIGGKGFSVVGDLFLGNRALNSASVEETCRELGEE